MTEPTVDPGLAAMVTELLNLKSQMELLDDDLKTLRQRYDDLRKRQLPDLMNNLGLVGPDGKATFTHSSGARVSLRHEVYASVPAEQQPDFFAWLREQGHGGLIKETVPAQTLKSFARELLEEGQPLPPQLSSHVETVAVITSPKKGAEL